MKRTAYIQRKLKAPNYAARAGQTIAGALGRGNDGKFVRAGSGDGSTPPPPTDRQRRTADRRQARLADAENEVAIREQEDAKIAAGKDGKERQALRRQIATDRRKRALDRKRAQLAERAADDIERAASPPKEPKDPKEPKKSGGGGGKGKPEKPAKLTDEDKRNESDARKAKLANATAARVGMNDADLNELRSLSTANAGSVTTRLQDMGLVQNDGDGAGFGLSDQGRRALSALERGDVRGYQAAVQDARSRLRREVVARQRRVDATARKQPPKPQPAPKVEPANDAPTPGARTRSDRYNKLYVRRSAARKERAPSLAVFKDARGNDRWLAITTTAYKDQDNEYISRRAIADAVRWGDKSGERGVLRYWHVKGFDLGDCDFQATSADGRMLIESGTFRSKAAASLGRRMAAAGWQMSPGFLHPPTEPADQVYDHILLFERSPCPPGKASNPYTQFVTKETPMDVHKLEQLKALTENEPELLATLMATIAQTDKAAQEAGAVYKEAPAWAQALISRIDALESTIKAGPPADAMIADAADEIAASASEMDAPDAEIETVDEEKAESLLDASEIAAIAQAVAAAIAPMFDLEKKMRAMTDEIKGTMSGVAAAKEADTAAAQKTIGALDTRIKQLEGEQPFAAESYRASADPQTALPAAMVAALKAQPHTVSANGAQPTGGDPIASFLSGFNLGGS
jgi:hypothetical protein